MLRCTALCCRADSSRKGQVTESEVPGAAGNAASSDLLRSQPSAFLSAGKHLLYHSYIRQGKS